jgi:hypothetical protein
MPPVDQGCTVPALSPSFASYRLMAPSNRGPTTSPSVVEGVCMSWREVDQRCIGHRKSCRGSRRPSRGPSRDPRDAPPVEPPRPGLPEWWELPARAADLEAQRSTGESFYVGLSGWRGREPGAAAAAGCAQRRADRDPSAVTTASSRPQALLPRRSISPDPVRAVGSGTIGGQAVLVYAAAERRAAHLNSTFQQVSLG